MITSIPRNVNFSTRQVVLRHANSVDAYVYRKTPLRQNDPVDVLNGNPTLGGLGVLDSEEEAEFEYRSLGEAKYLPTGVYEGSEIGSRDDNLTPRQLVEAQIVCVVDPDDEAAFVPEKHDLVLLLPGAQIALFYEIVDISGGLNIPPFTRRYVLNPQDDLHQLDDIAVPDDVNPPVGPDRRAR